MSTTAVRKFRRDRAQQERTMTLQRRAYEDTPLATCNVVPQRLGSVEPMARPTLEDMGTLPANRTVYGMGIKGRDLLCKHEARIANRMGHARCALCHGWLFCASWVADGWMGDATLTWANDEAERMAVRCEESERRAASEQRWASVPSLSAVPTGQEPLFEG